MDFRSSILKAAVFFALFASSLGANGDTNSEWMIPRFSEPPLTWDGSQVVEGTGVAPTWGWHARVGVQYSTGLGLAKSASQVRGDLGFGLGLPGNLELALGLPFGWTYCASKENGLGSGKSQFDGLGEVGPAVGDLKAALLFSAYDAESGGLGLLIGLKGSAPTGNPARLTGEGDFTLEPLVVGAFQLLGTRISLNLAYRIRQEHRLHLDGKLYEQDDELIWRAGIRIPRKHDVAWSIEAEGGIGMATDEGAWASPGSRPIWIGVGVDFPLTRHYRLGLYSGAGLVGYSVPTFTVGASFFILPKAKDEDNDGIATSDQCPLLKEDIDGFKDKDGCPDLDNDKDGFPDDEDQCPLAPADTFSDDGC